MATPPKSVDDLISDLCRLREASPLGGSTVPHWCQHGVPYIPVGDVRLETTDDGAVVVLAAGEDKETMTTTGKPRHSTVRETLAQSPQADAVLGSYFGQVSGVDTQDSIELLESSTFKGTDALAAAVAMRMHEHPLRAVKRTLTLVETLALTVALINAEAIDPDTIATDEAAIADTVQQLDRSRVRGLYDTPQEAAFAAVRQIGGAPQFGVPAYIEAQLGDTRRNAGADAIREVETLAESNHGWYWRYVLHVGFVLFRLTDH